MAAAPSASLLTFSELLYRNIELEMESSTWEFYLISLVHLLILLCTLNWLISALKMGPSKVSSILNKLI